jgi:hypothetical protein
MYRHERSNGLPSSVVETFALAYGPVEGQGMAAGQWLHLQATKANGTTLGVWLLCNADPPANVTQARNVVVRYILQEPNAEPVEFRDPLSSRAVLPVLGAWPHLLPRPADGVAAENGFPRTAKLLGHRYRLERLEDSAPMQAPPAARVVALLADVLLGMPHNTKQADDTRRYDGSDYKLVPLTRADYDAMIEAGMNCFYVDAQQRSWLEGRGVYYWGEEIAGLPYPESLYRSSYLGPALFLDEPAVGARDQIVRPRLRQDARWRHELTPQIVLEVFQEHFRRVKYEGPPTSLRRGLSAMAGVQVGDMNFLQENLFTWETMISTAVYQLTEGGGPPPSAMVFEPPGRFGTRRTLPEMNLTYGCQVPIDNPANLAGIIYGFLRGAARLSDRDWGASIYGAVDRADAGWLLTHAYDLGARMFFFWDTYQLACVPFSECLALSRHLKAHIQSHPHRDLPRLKQAAETVLLLPPGYNLGHVHLGKGSLWGLGELNLERTNTHGIKYRAVMHNLFTEIERCIRLGIAYDLLWDLPGLDVAGYREAVRIREDGKVEVRDENGRALHDGPRTPARPRGAPPRLTLQVSLDKSSAPARVTAQARVVEGSAPVFYTIGANRRGVYENAVVFWELFGPLDEDYRVLLGENAEPRVEREGASYRVTVTFGISRPGTYRLRAAAADQAGRSAVVWQMIVLAR